MAYFKMSIHKFPRGVDNAMRRRLIYGYMSLQPDSPTGTPVYTYTTGGLQVHWDDLEPLNTDTPLPEWLEADTLLQQATRYRYLWTPGAQVTAVAIASRVLTATAQNNFQVGDRVEFRAFTGLLAYLNQFPVTIATRSATQFTAAVNLPNQTSATVNGLAVGLNLVSGLRWQGNMRIMAPAGTELAAGAITNVQADIMHYRAEFIRVSTI